MRGAGSGYVAIAVLLQGQGAVKPYTASPRDDRFQAHRQREPFFGTKGRGVTTLHLQRLLQLVCLHQLTALILYARARYSAYAILLFGTYAHLYTGCNPPEAVVLSGTYAHPYAYAVLLCVPAFFFRIQPYAHPQPVWNHAAQAASAHEISWHVASMPQAAEVAARAARARLP